jgi:hypothetical protein
MPKAKRAHRDNVVIEDLFLGKGAPKKDKRTLKLATFLDPKALPPVPGSIDYTTGQDSPWGVLLNDRIGCCTCAACGHIRQVTTSMVGTQVSIADRDILTAYEAVSGYRPTDPNNPQTNATDNGANMLDVMNYWRKTGIGGNKSYAFAAVDLTNTTEIKQAVYLFGNVYLGLALPMTAADQIRAGKRWTVVSTSGAGKPGSWGGHAVNIAWYNSQTWGILTWGQKQGMSRAFLRDYADEGYVVLTPEWINQATQKAPNGIDWVGLGEAMTHFPQAA